MTGTLRTQALLWIICTVCIIVDGESCPKGARVHLSSLRCFWLSEKSSSWTEAQESCSETHGGELASASGFEPQDFLNFFPVKTTEWVWMLRQEWPEDDESEGGCSQMALGTHGRWRKASCSERYLSLCEKKVTGSLPSVDHYLTGLVVMTGVYAYTQIRPLHSVPDIGQQTVEMQLFPGLWFSHAGQLTKVELVVQPNLASLSVRIQILRPYCKPNHHLVPPGCRSLLNPFSCCSAVPLCNTTGGCGKGQYWCHLLEACMTMTSPCSPYDSAAQARDFFLPPRYVALSPLYHVAADIPFEVKPSSELRSVRLLLAEEAIMVYPDDIVAIQHTADPGKFLHCLNREASLNSSWCQSYLSFRGVEWGGWLEAGLTSLPDSSEWVDGVVCNLKILYVDALHKATEHDEPFDFTHAEMTTVSGLDSSLRSHFQPTFIHPLPDEKNQIHVQINAPTLIVVKATFGQKAKSLWSAPINQTGIPFLPSCPEEIDRSSPGCMSHDASFSSVTLILPSLGVHNLNVTIMDGETSQSVTVKVVGHEAVAGLTLEPSRCLRMLVNMSQSLTAKVESGSTVKFTWVIDDLHEFAYEGESYSVMFKKPNQYKLQVTASNLISSQSLQILVSAEEATLSLLPEFLSVTEVVALDVAYIYTIRVKVDVSLPVTLRWDFGDSGNNLIHSQPAPCQTMKEVEETGVKQVYVHDSVNYTYSTPENYRLHVQVSNQYDNTEAFMWINVRPHLSHLVISTSSPVSVIQQPLHFEASVKPSDFGVSYTWDFGDGLESVQSINCKVSHIFAVAGLFNITVSANNTFSSLTAWLLLGVFEKISGLTVSHSRPSEAGFATKFRAEVTSGTNLLWDFDFGDGLLRKRLTADSISHIFKFPGKYRVNVTVSNAVSQAHKSIVVEVYNLTIKGVLPAECIMTRQKIHFTALVNGNASILTFHWLFGDGSPLNVETGQPTITHMFLSHGFYSANLTVISPFTSVSFTFIICVLSPISKIAVQVSKNIVAVGENVCLMVLVLPEQMTGYQFKWRTNPFGLWSAKTEKSEKCFVFNEEGIEEILILAINDVSNKTAKVYITIQKPVSTFSIGLNLPGETLTVNMLAFFWVEGCVGTNVSVIWDFGDGSLVKQMQNVSHVFTAQGQFTVNATAFNQVSHNSATLNVNVLFPVSDLSLHTNQSYTATGEETLFTAVSSNISTTEYYWIIVGLTSTKRGTDHFRFVFLKPGVYQVKVLALDLINQREATASIEVFERIEGLEIECFSLVKSKYVSTHEKIQCFPSVTKGSNVTYYWLSTQSEIMHETRGNGETFHVTTETPGIISVQLRAVNVLGQVSSRVSFVAVESITNVHIEILSNTVAFSEVVNISVVVDTGSDLKYFWYVDSDSLFLQTSVPFLLLTFTNLGRHLVEVLVENAISQGNDTIGFMVVEEIVKVDFKINNRKHPFYVNASAALSLHGFVQQGSDLQWEWKIRSANGKLFTSTNQTVIYAFSQVGIYQVYLNVSNVINWQTVLHNVTVQDAIRSLQLNISKLTLCAGELVDIFPTISEGTNVSFVIIVTNRDGVPSESISEGHYETSNLPVGRNLVTVKALNHVSSAEMSAIVNVIEKIQGLRLVNCCSTALEALKAKQFKADIQSDCPVNYTYVFEMEQTTFTQLTGEVTFTPSESGLLSVRVLASNGVCSQELNETVTVEWPVKKVKLICWSNRVFVGHAAWFSAVVTEGSNIRYVWDFGNSTETFVTQSNNMSYTYNDTGKYLVMVNVINDVSQVSEQLLIEVEELQCPIPEVTLIQNQSTFVRSRKSFFEASIKVNCSAYKTIYRWEIFREPFCSNNSSDLFVNKVILEDAASPFLLIPKSTLEVGHYCLVFTASHQGTPLLVQRKAAIIVVHSPLVAVIKGGSHRLWPGLSDLVVDGSDSKDPDMEPGADDTLHYHWAFVMARSTQAHFVKQPTVSINNQMTILSTQLHAGSIYIFTLTVHKEGRSASINQTVTVTDAPVIPVSVRCISCSSTYQFSHTNSIILAGQCEECDDHAQYKWRAEDQTRQTLELDNVTTTTGRHSQTLVVRSGVLKPGYLYSFVLDVSQPATGQWGKASYNIKPNSPPHGGLCQLSPKSNVRLLETFVTYNCSGWQNEDSNDFQLIYTFQAVLCPSISSKCPVLTLYRGSQSTFSSLVPMGISAQQQNTSVITVILWIEDHLEAKVIALEKALTVENPTQDKITSKWLKKSQAELLALLLRGNPQEIIPYSMALISKLNQMEFARTAEEPPDRQELRNNLTQALTSLPVSSMLDVDQISSALSQSTAVPGELVCVHCHEKVLEIVGKMIHVLNQQSSPSVLPVVSAGRNILRIIGSTLAAGSKTVRTQSPATKSLDAEHSIALLGLEHVPELIRVLMRSHIHSKASLLLSTNHITTVGFQGSPSELLCTELDQHPVAHSQFPPDLCRFHIPASLTARLQRGGSDVVQVLFKTNDALEADVLFSEADPPISTNLVAMELTSPQGQPIPIHDLRLEQAIRVTLPNRKLVNQGSAEGNWRGGEVGNGTCLTVTIPSQGRLNFTVKTPEDLDERAGLYVSFNFRLVPGAIPVSRGHVKVEVALILQGTNAFQDYLWREWPLTLPSPTSSSEETVFLSPLLNGTDGPLSVNMTSSLVDGGPVQTSVCVFSSLCQFYSVKERRWSSKGLRPLEGSTLNTAHCLTQHLTMFGASLFVHPGAVILLPPSTGQVTNVVVGIVCAALVLIHLLVGLIAHKLDHMDSLKLNQVPLCGRPGLFHYRVLVKTGWKPGAGTTAHVGICLYGVNKSGSRHLQRDGAFQRGNLDQFHVETDDNLGEVWKIRIWHDNTGLDPSWYVQHVVVWDPRTDHMFFFLVDHWLSLENQNTGTVEKEVLASCPDELSQFRRILISQMMFGLMERHLWLSLWLRPAHSRFTRAQRVTCSAILLHLYLAFGALWYGAVGTEENRKPASANLLVYMEIITVGMTIAALVFPLQCLICLLFRKAHSSVTTNMSLPPSPICHSVETMEIGHSGRYQPSFLCFPDSSGPLRDSVSSLLESKALDSSVLDFWAASGLVDLATGTHEGEGVLPWESCDSLLNLSTGMATTPDGFKALLVQGTTHHLRRKKNISSSVELHKRTPHIIPNETPLGNNPTTLLTLSEEDLLMSIAADVAISNSDSGQDSLRTTSSFSTMSDSCNSWLEQSEEKSMYGATTRKPDIQSYTTPNEPRLYKYPSVLSVDSVASTFLPSLSPDSSRSLSTTRIGVVRGQPSWQLPPWAVSALYLLVAVLLGACLAAVGLYGSFLSRKVVLMWLASVISAFITSALLLEPLKVCVQALVHTALWRSVDPEIEEQLARETMVVRTFGEQGVKVRPPCGYGLLQAKEEARKLQALRTLMKHCVCQLLFLLLVLLVNYQDGMEQRQSRLLLSTVRQRLHTAPPGFPNLSSLRDWPDTEQWISHILLPHLYQNPRLRLMGSPQLQYTNLVGTLAVELQGSESKTRWVITNLTDMTSKMMMKKKKTQFEWIAIDFTHHHMDSSLFICVSLRLAWSEVQPMASSFTIHPLFITSSSSELDLQFTLMIVLLISALLILFGELRCMATEHAQYLRQCHHWFQLSLALLALAAAVLQLCSQSLAFSCISKFQAQPHSFINFHRAAFLTEKSSQCAAVLLMLLIMKLLGTLKFMRKWVVIGRVLQKTWRELMALAVLVLLLLLLCTHLGNTLFSGSVEGFLSLHDTSVSALSMLRGREVLQRLCRVHPVLGPLYGLLLFGGCIWLLAHFCGAVLIRTYRAVQAEWIQPAIEPQDDEMVEFFVKRLKLWMGLTKAKQFRHRVKFEGMDAPPSRASQESRLSNLTSPQTSCHSPSLSSSFSFSSPRPPSSVLSIWSEDSSGSEIGLEVQRYLDSLMPCVSVLISCFDRVNQVIEDIQNLEVQLHEAQSRIRKTRMSSKEESQERVGELKTKGTDEREVRHRKFGLLHPRSRISLPSSFPFVSSSLQSTAASVHIIPRLRSSYSESESSPKPNSHTLPSELTKPTPGISGFNVDSLRFSELPRRRAWHSGSSHSADATQRGFQLPGVDLFRCGGDNLLNARPRSEEGPIGYINNGVPLKKKAWISEEPDKE